jgi:hypothetical protein
MVTNLFGNNFYQMILHSPRLISHSVIFLKVNKKFYVWR